MDDLNIQAGVTVNAEQAERAFTNLGDKAQKMANEVTKAADKAGKATDGMGDGAEKGAEKFTRAESRMRAAIQKSTRELEMLGKTASQKFEAQLEFKGLDKAKFQPFLAELRKTEEAAAKAQAGVSGIGDAAKVAGSMMAAAFSGAAITGFLGKVVSVQREFDVLNSSLKTVTGSSAAAEREMAWLKDFAKETPFGLAQATQGFVKMKALGLDPTRAALTSFGNTASAMGKDLNQMIEAVADASTGEFERLKEFGVKAKKEGDQVSLTFQGVTTTIGNNAREITQYLEDIGNTSFGGAMEERAKTLDGTIAALGDTWDELFRTVSTNNVGSLIFDSVTLANGALEDATTILRAMGGAAQDASRDTGALSTIQNGIATVFETVAVLGANLKYVLVQIGNEIGGLAAQVAQAAQFNFSGVAAIRQAMVADAEAARKEIDATTARILNARKAQEEYARYATRNASAATDPRRVDLGGSTTRAAGGASSGAAKAVKETISEYDKLIKKLSDELPKAAAEAEAAQMGYNKAQTEFLALAGSPAWASFSNSQRAVVASMFEGKIASEEAGEAAKALSKAYAEAAAERIKTIQSMEHAADSLQSQNDALREEIELIGLSTEQQTLVLQQRNDVIILTKEATLAELERQSAVTGTQTRVEIALAAEIAALKERNKLLGAKAGKNAAQDLEKANADAAKKAQEDWERTSEQINSTLTDALMRGFESGKDFAKNLRDTVVNMFKTMVLRPVISAIINPISGALTGMMGLSGAAQAGQGGNAASTAMSAASMFGAGGLGGSLAAGAGWMTGATTLGGSLSAATSLIAAPGGLMSGLGMMAGALGPIAIGIAALSSLIKKKTAHTGAASTYSEAGGLVSGEHLWGTDGFKGSADYNAGVEQVTGNVAKAIGDTLNATAKAFGKTAGYEISTAFADDKSKDGAWGSLIIKQMGAAVIDWRDTQTSKWAPKEFADGEAGSKEYLAEVAKSTRDALAGAIGDVDWATDMLTALGESPTIEGLSQTVQQINATQAAFDAFGENIVGFGDLTDGATSALVKAAGGTEELVSATSAYYDNFYSEGEKAANSTRDIAKELAKVGLEMPTTREGFRALVEQQMKLGEAGAPAVAALLGVNSAFFSVTARLTGLKNETKQLEIELLRASGKTAEADAQLRKLATEGFNDAERAAYDYNETLKKQIQTYKSVNSTSTSSSQGGAVFGGTGGGEYKEVEAVSDAWKDMLASIVESTLAAQTELSRLGMTSYERALAEIQDNAQARLKELLGGGYMSDTMQTRDSNVRGLAGWESLKSSYTALEASGVLLRPGWESDIDATIAALKTSIAALNEELAKMPPEIQALIDAETALLDARNAITAGELVGDLQTEVSRLGFTALEKELAGISDRAEDYIKSLRDLGQATDANIEAVRAWEEAMLEAAAEADREEDRRRREAAREEARRRREAAQGIVDGTRGSLDNLIKSLTEGASKASGGAIGRLSVTGAEYEQFQGFSQQLDGATQALKELEKLGLGDELKGYADQIGAIVRETETLLAGQLSSARLTQGDAEGALAALRAASDLTYDQFATAGAYNTARAQEDARNALRLYTQASADALAVSGIDGVLGTLQTTLADPQLWQAAAQAITRAIVQASGDVGFAVRDAVAGVAGVLARQGLTSVSGPGIAGIHAAQSALALAGTGGWARGSWQMGEDVVAYGQALDRLDGMLKTGKLSAQEHADAIGALNTAMGSAADLLDDTAAQAERLAAAQQAVGDAGLQSIGYYFGWYGRESDRLAEAARQAGTALGQTTDAIGRLESASSVFSQSARAASTWEAYAGLSSVSKSRLVADSAQRAAAAMTTADAERAAAALAKTGVFGNVRDAALMLDGVGQYDSEGFEDAFARIGAALGRGQISEAGYKALFDTALELYKTGTTSAEEAARNLTSSFERLRDVMGDFADGLLIGDKTTLNAGQTLAEIQRQYTQAVIGSANGDTDAMGKYQQLANTLLDKDRYSTQAEYNAVFGSVYGDARQLENIGVNTLANAQGNEMVSELKDMNAKLNKRVEDLEKNLIAALAQIAKNTSDTSRGIEQQIVMAEDTP